VWKHLTSKNGGTQQCTADVFDTPRLDIWLNLGPAK
jgi:hypothetical protein